MKVKIYMYVFVFMQLMGCDSKLEKEISLPSDEVLQLDVKQSSIEYAGQGTTSVIARIPKDAGNLDVKFSATHGRFIASNDKSVSEYADSVADNYRYASVIFKSDSTVGTVYITADVTGVRQRVEVVFVK